MFENSFIPFVNHLQHSLAGARPSHLLVRDLGDDARKAPSSIRQHDLVTWSEIVRQIDEFGGGLPELELLTPWHSPRTSWHDGLPACS
jgi:hypothetical protein